MRKRLFLYVFPCALVFAACDPGEKVSPDNAVDSVDYSEESVPPLPESPPVEELPPETTTQFEGLSEESAAAHLDELLLLKGPIRHQSMTEFFKALSKSNPALALELLPENLAHREQLDWAVPIAAGLMRAGDPENAAFVLNAIFTSTLRTAAIVACIESFPDTTSGEDAIRFWGLLDEQGTSDRASGPLASFLAHRDPVRAVEWYESLDSRIAQRHALEFVSGNDREAITRQLEIAEDMPLRRKLAKDLGASLIESNVDLAAALSEIRRLPAGVIENAQTSFAKGYGNGLRDQGLDQAGAMEELKKLPQEMIPEAEAAYVDRISINISQGKTDVEALEAYVTDGLTEEGKDRAQTTLALEAFSANPTKGMEMFLDTGLSERHPVRWSMMVERWLTLDAGAASEYVLNMDAGSTRDLAIEAIVKHLKTRGDQEAIDAWKGEFTESGRAD